MSLGSARSMEQTITIIELRIKVETLENKILKLQSLLDEKETPLIYWQGDRLSPQDIL
jgi:hypothetical protein